MTPQEKICKTPSICTAESDNNIKFFLAGIRMFETYKISLHSAVRGNYNPAFLAYFFSCKCIMYYMCGPATKTSVCSVKSWQKFLVCIKMNVILDFYCLLCVFWGFSGVCVFTYAMSCSYPYWLRIIARIFLKILPVLKKSHVWVSV